MCCWPWRPPARWWPLDCVEYNPARDSDGSCCRTVLGILEPVLLALAAKP